MTIAIIPALMHRIPSELMGMFITDLVHLGFHILKMLERGA
jgi:uncharacterized membrane protein